MAGASTMTMPLRTSDPIPQNGRMTANDDVAPRVHGRTPATDEVLRCIGRNVVVFQQIEYLLKHLNKAATVAGAPDRIAALLEKRAETVSRMTMGTLAGELLGNVLGTPDECAPPAGTDHPWVQLRQSIEADVDKVERHDREMRALVDARNDLIHHFLPRWESAVDGDADVPLAYLDAQYEEAKRTLERLYHWARSVDNGRRQIAEFLGSPEAEQQFELAFIRSSRLVVMLGEVAMQSARADGWTVLSTAGQLIKQTAPSELQDLHVRFGHSNLKGLLLATGVFDVHDEPTPAGGKRTIYRINEHYELRNQ